jgi:hypothetical protein
MADRGPGFTVQWKALLIWLAIIAGLYAVVSLLRLPERMECQAWGGRRMICKHGLLSPETWGPPGGRPAHPAASSGTP